MIFIACEKVNYVFVNWVPVVASPLPLRVAAAVVADAVVDAFAETAFVALVHAAFAIDSGIR